MTYNDVELFSVVLNLSGIDHLSAPVGFKRKTRFSSELRNHKISASRLVQLQGYFHNARATKQFYQECSNFKSVVVSSK